MVPPLKQKPNNTSEPRRKALADVTNVIAPDLSKPAAKQKCRLQSCENLKDSEKNTQEISKRKTLGGVTSVNRESPSIALKPPLVGRKVSFRIPKSSLVPIVKGSASKQTTKPDAKTRGLSLPTLQTNRLQSRREINVASQINSKSKHSANEKASTKTTCRVSRSSSVVLHKSKILGSKIQASRNGKKSISDGKPEKNSRRRKSFTSLLLEKSVLPVQHGLKLYDKSNELEVADYADDIYQHYWIMEVERKIPCDYMSIQTEITPKLRGIMVNWLTEVHHKYELMPETLYLMVVLFDQYLSQVPVKKNELQLVGITSLLIASKYEDFWHPLIKDLIGLTVDSYTRQQVLVMESCILKTLRFQVNSPTLYLLMLGFLKAAKCYSQVEHLALYLIELSLAEYEALQYAPSLVCASAVYVARMTCRLTPAWTSTLATYSSYKEAQIKKCGEMILRLQKCARTSSFDVTYRKYSSVELGAVARMTPLDKIM